MSILGNIPTMVTGQEDWAPWAACTSSDPEAWFPDKGQPSQAAKRICATCPVTAECLEWALAHKERHSVWGGLSERERRRIQTRRLA